MCAVRAALSEEAKFQGIRASQRRESNQRMPLEGLTVERNSRCTSPCLRSEIEPQRPRGAEDGTVLARHPQIHDF
jgi:hypothetical protein